MFLSTKLVLLAVFGFMSVEINADDLKGLGSLYQCAHGLRGNVWVKNEREILIEGFNYDGKGPSAWFHGQLRGAKGISTTDPDSYVTLPYPGDSCERLKPGRDYKDENVTLILPRSIKDFETIGVFCYQYCHNFGHIVIPSDLSVSPAPSGLQTTPECEKPKYDGCPSPRNGDIKPDCAAGASQNMMMSGNNGAARLTFISGWFIFSMFLTFGKY